MFLNHMDENLYFIRRLFLKVVLRMYWSMAMALDGLRGPKLKRTSNSSRFLKASMSS